MWGSGDLENSSSLLPILQNAPSLKLEPFAISVLSSPLSLSYLTSSECARFISLQLDTSATIPSAKPTAPQSATSIEDIGVLIEAARRQMTTSKTIHSIGRITVAISPPRSEDFDSSDKDDIFQCDAETHDKR